MPFVVKPLGSHLIVGFFGGTQARRFEMSACDATGPVVFNGSLAAAYIAGLQASHAVQVTLAGTPAAAHARDPAGVTSGIEASAHR